MPGIPIEVLKTLKSVSGKRPRTVIEHIIKHGYVTTEELKNLYGYNHPPRAAHDVREHGIPLETFRVEDSTGRSIGAYRFGRWEDFRTGTLTGRAAFPKEFKGKMVAHYSCKCHICGAALQERYLQIDHRVPYQVTGEHAAGKRHVARYMLVCSSCNRAKSWSCEHCANWSGRRSVSVCHACYWAAPERYKHVAQQDIRTLALVWQGKEVADYDMLVTKSRKEGREAPDFVKRVLKEHLRKSRAT